MSATFALSVGRYGGFYAMRIRGGGGRVNLGWLSLTLFPYDLDDVLHAGLDTLASVVPEAGSGASG